MENKKYYLYLSLILLFGIGIRLYWSHLHPIWLDEQYSLLFATQENSADLLIGFSKDVHPGFYYLILKSLLPLTTNLFLLRIIAAVIPQIVGVLILIIMIGKEINRKTALALATVFATNPFFVHQSWQLRNYGLIFLITGISYILTTKLRRHFNKKNLALLIAILFIGNMSHYVMFIYSFCIGLYLILASNKTKKMKGALLTLTIAALVGQFTLHNGLPQATEFKSQFSQASWIYKPSLNQIPQVYLISLGLVGNQDYFFSQHSLTSLLSYLVVGWLFIFSYKHSSQKQKQKLKMLVFLPLFVILATSTLLPFLSQRLFFHKFIPNLSIFIPRIHLPFIIIFWIHLLSILIKKTTSIVKKRTRLLLTAISIFIVAYWLYLPQQAYLYAHRITLDRQESLQKILNLSSNKKLYLWPHWMWLEAIIPERLSQIDQIKQLQQQSRIIEKEFTQATELSCSTLSQSQFFIYTPASKTELELQNKVSQTINDCCQIGQKIGVYQGWDCP